MKFEQVLNETTINNLIKMEKAGDKRARQTSFIGPITKEDRRTKLSFEEIVSQFNDAFPGRKFDNPEKETELRNVFSQGSLTPNTAQVQKQSTTTLKDPRKKLPYKPAFVDIISKKDKRKWEEEPQ